MRSQSQKILWVYSREAPLGRHKSPLLTCEEAVEGWRYSLGLTATVVAILSCCSAKGSSSKVKIRLHAFQSGVESVRFEFACDQTKAFFFVCPRKDLYTFASSTGSATGENAASSSAALHIISTS